MRVYIRHIAITLLSTTAILLGAAQADSPRNPASSAPVTAKKPTCDLELGRRVFAQCAMCHSLEKGAAPIAGPNLHGVIGRKAAAGEGFRYSKALRESAKQWTPQELDAFLAQPMGYVPGTLMAFAGLKNPQEREAVICYLESAGR